MAKAFNDVVMHVSFVSGKRLAIKLFNKPKIVWRSLPWSLSGKCVGFISQTKTISHAYSKRQRTFYKDENVFGR